MQHQPPTPVPPKMGAPHLYLKDALSQVAQQPLRAAMADGALAEAQVTTTAGNSQGEQAFKAAMNEANTQAALPQAPQAQVPALVPGTPVNNEAFLGRELVNTAYNEYEKTAIAALQRRLPVVQK